MPPTTTAWNVRIALDARDQLGEGPHWDHVDGELLRVDIARGRVHGWSPVDGETWTWELPGREVSAVVPRSAGGHLLAVDRELVVRDATGRFETIAVAEADREENRFNDCRADPQGRLWAGTMSKRRAPGTAGLYRLRPGEPLEQVVGGTTISNGIGWSPDGAQMWFVDSTTQRIDAFDFDGSTGELSERRPFARIAPADGLPDGLAVDADGGVWVCLFGGGAVRRYGPEGTLDAVIPLPVTNPTCPTFGGRDLATLYVTSARHRLTAGQLAAEPLAGALLALDPGVRGLPANRCGAGVAASLAPGRLAPPRGLRGARAGRMGAMPPDAIRNASQASQAFGAALDVVAGVAPEVVAAIRGELEDQRRALKLIASENYSSPAVQLAMGQWMTDKYAEGAPGKRWYAGCENVDAVEEAAASLARELFGADHAYVQPHSGADANLVAFSAILAERVEKPFLAEHDVRDTRLLPPEQWEALRQRLVNQRMLAMELTSGGHLTHGMRANLSAKLFQVVPYGVDPESGLLDYERIRELALETRPLLILAGHSSYPRKLDFRRFRAIADEVGAVLMVDMAHFAGLVAGGVFEGDFDPVPHAHIVTSTTHKTLRGPRGGLVLCTAEFADAIDRGCPMILGGPLPHVMAAKAVAFHEALDPSFRDYAAAIVANARALADALVAEGETLQTGGTENHLLLVDVRPHGLNGQQAEAALRRCDIVLNRNVLPYDPNGPWFTSGIRLGTPALTTRGFDEDAMRQIAGLISTVLRAAGPIEDKREKPALPDALVDEVRAAVEDLTSAHPLYPELVV